MPRLTLTKGPQSGTGFPFENTVVVGRGSTADVAIDDTTVSRRHARLVRETDGWTVADLGTPNGTWVNGTRILQATRLKNGDELRLGTADLRFEDTARGARAEAPAVSIVDKAPMAGAVVARMEANAPATGGQDTVRLQALARRLEFLSDLSGPLAQTFDEAAQLDRIIDKLFELLPQAERGFIIVLKEGSEELEPRAVRKRSGDAAGITVSRTLVNEAITKRQGILSVDAMSDHRWTEAASVAGLSLRSVVCVPIVAQDEVFGVIQVDSTRPGVPFSQEDMALMLGISRQLALSLGNARLHARLVHQELMEHDLALAGRLQQRFLPKKLPEVPGYSFAVEYSPAFEVGGDLYYFLELAHGCVGIAVGDVSGKGVSAALCMAKLTSELRYHSVGHTEPCVILERVNRALISELEEGMFVTVALLVLDPARGELKVSLAGHPSPLARDAAGHIVELGRTGGSPLGVTEDATFAQDSYTLDRSDVVVVFSDGVTEALDKKKALFGDDRFAASVKRAVPKPSAVKDAVLEDVDAFVAGAPQSDDLTLVCFGRD